jgi:hypothetical protein
MHPRVGFVTLLWLSMFLEMTIMENWRMLSFIVFFFFFGVGFLGFVGLEFGTECLWLGWMTCVEIVDRGRSCFRLSKPLTLFLLSTKVSATWSRFGYLQICSYWGEGHLRTYSIAKEHFHTCSINSLAFLYDLIHATLMFLLSSLGFSFVQLCLLLHPKTKNGFLLFCLNLVWSLRKIGKNKRDRF